MRFQGRTRALLLSLASVAVAGFAALRLKSGVGSVDTGTLGHHVTPLVAATLLFATATLFLASAWIALIHGSTNERASSRPRLYVAFALAWIARYVPGTVPFFAGKVYLARNLGYSSRPLLIATGIENVLEILVAGFVGCVLLLLSRGTHGDVLYVALGLGAAAGLATLHPAVFSRLANRILTVAKREPVPHGSFPSTRTLVTAAAFIVLNQLINGVALLLILRATAGMDWNDLALVTGALSTAGTAGVLVVFLPAGFGVRDGALAGLLATRVAFNAAALGTIVMRLVTVCADLLLVSAAIAFDWASGGEVTRGFLRGQSSTAGERHKPAIGVAEKAA